MKKLICFVLVGLIAGGTSFAQKASRVERPPKEAPPRSKSPEKSPRPGSMDPVSNRTTARTKSTLPINLSPLQLTEVEILAARPELTFDTLAADAQTIQNATA